MPRTYRFTTTWCLAAPIEPVWEAIHDSLAWPSWWKGVVRVEELEPGDELGLGSLQRFTWKSRLPYELSFDMRSTLVAPPHRLEGEASGELAGHGRWRLFEHDGVTAVIYDWEVGTTRRWMNLFGPLLRPAFAWNHDVVMRSGGEGIERLLGKRQLVAF